MKPPRVVNVVDEARKIGGDVLESLVVHQIHRLDLEGLHETLSFRIVVGVAPPSHRADQAMLGEQLAVDLGGVLRPSIGTMHAARRRSTSTERGLEGRQRQSGIDRPADRITLAPWHRGPDPDAVIEMHEGAGNAPAYRGLLYLTFDGLPLKGFGNRIPNITTEVVATALVVHPNQHVDVFGQGVEHYGKGRLDHRSGRPRI